MEVLVFCQHKKKAHVYTVDKFTDERLKKKKVLRYALLQPKDLYLQTNPTFTKRLLRFEFLLFFHEFSLQFLPTFPDCP